MNEQFNLSEGVLSAGDDGEQGELVAALAPWSGTVTANHALIARTVAGAVGPHWPVDANDIVRTVERICRAVVARLSRTGADDWSVVNFGPGHGIAGVSVQSEQTTLAEIQRQSTVQGHWTTVASDSEALATGAMTPYIDRSTLMVAITIWELDVVTDDETPEDHARWEHTVTARLRAVLGHLSDELGIQAVLRQSSGQSPFPYARQELVVLRPLPRQESDMIDIALMCARLVEASLLVYTLVEERTKEA